jgi:hypothetical protein
MIDGKCKRRHIYTYMREVGGERGGTHIHNGLEEKEDSEHEAAEDKTPDSDIPDPAPSISTVLPLPTIARNQVTGKTDVHTEKRRNIYKYT